MTNYRQTLTEAYRQVQERELTPKELKRREEIAKDLPLKILKKDMVKKKVCKSKWQLQLIWQKKKR